MQLFGASLRKAIRYYTVPSDHLNCPIGSYTHAIDLPPERAGELEQTLALMTSVGYVRMEEVPAIPRLPRTPAITYYAPLAATVVDPDVVIFAGRPGRLMRLLAAVMFGPSFFTAFPISSSPEPNPCGARPGNAFPASLVSSVSRPFADSFLAPRYPTASKSAPAPRGRAFLLRSS